MNKLLKLVLLIKIVFFIWKEQVRSIIIFTYMDEMNEWLIEFNNMSTHPGLFYA